MDNHFKYGANINVVQSDCVGCEAKKKSLTDKTKDYLRKNKQSIADGAGLGAAIGAGGLTGAAAYGAYLGSKKLMDKFKGKK